MAVSGQSLKQHPFQRTPVLPEGILAVVAKKELTERQKTVLQWIADDCPEKDWDDRYYKQSARMMASYDLVKIKGHGETWEAAITDRGKRVLAGAEALVTQKKKPNSTAPPIPAPSMPPRTPPKDPTPVRQRPSTDVLAFTVESLFKRLLAAEFHVVGGLPLADSTETDWEYIVQRLRSSKELLGDKWRISSRTRAEGSYLNPTQYLDVAIAPIDVWISETPEAVQAQERVSRYHPAVTKVMKYSTNISTDLQPRARRLLHSLFSEVDARGWKHQPVDVGPYSGHKTSRERGSLGVRDTGYGFNDGRNDYFVSVTEKVDRVEREPTKKELQEHRDQLRWYSNREVGKFYDRPYNGKLTLTIGNRQAKDTARRFAEAALPTVFAAIAIDYPWIEFDKDMKRRADDLWAKKKALAEKRADEIYRNASLHDSLKERAAEWDKYLQVERYVADLRAHVDRTDEEVSGDGQRWLEWCMEHFEESHPMRNLSFPKISSQSGYERDHLVHQIAQRIRDDEVQKNLD